MKTIKIFIQALLSLILVSAIVCSCLLFNASAFFKSENLATVFSELSSGSRILNYKYLSENKTEDDFYASLSDAIPVQVALVVDISSENARICQEGAFEYVKNQNLEGFVYNSLDLLAEELSTGYTQTAIDNNIINPDAYITYMNVHRERVTDTKRNLLMETIYQKYRAILSALDGEGYFCALNADGKNTFLYVLSSGNKAIRMQNELYHLIEEKSDVLYDEHLLNFFERLKGNSTAYELLDAGQYANCIEEEIFSFIEGQGLSFEFADKEIVHRKLEPGLKNDLYQRFVNALPLYEDTVSSTPAPVMSLIPRLFNNSLTYIALGICLLAILLIIVADRKRSLYFIGAALFISGLIITSGRLFSTDISERILAAADQTKNALSIIVPDSFERFLINLSAVGICLIVFGAAIFFLSILVNRRKTAE